MQEGPTSPMGHPYGRKGEICVGVLCRYQRLGVYLERGRESDLVRRHAGLSAVELNASFYRFLFPNQIAGWARRGSTLRWCVKAHWLITHRHRLNRRPGRSGTGSWSSSGPWTRWWTTTCCSSRSALRMRKEFSPSWTRHPSGSSWQSSSGEGLSWTTTPSAAGCRSG
jgi:hypothetical protein